VDDGGRLGEEIESGEADWQKFDIVSFTTGKRPPRLRTETRPAEE